MTPALKTLLILPVVYSTLGGGLKSLGTPHDCIASVSIVPLQRPTNKTVDLFSRLYRAAFPFIYPVSCPTYDAVREVMRVEQLEGVER